MREAVRIVNLQVGRIVRNILQREGRIPVGPKSPVRVIADPPTPPQHPDVEIEDPSWVAAGKQDRKERHDAEHEEGQPQEGQDYVMGYRE